MYPKFATDTNHVKLVITKEDLWMNIMTALGSDTQIRDLWRMSTLLWFFPQGVRIACAAAVVRTLRSLSNRSGDRIVSAPTGRD